MPSNQRVSAPFGDVNFFQTPKTDRFINTHLQQERQDELLRNRQVEDMDKQLSGHIGNILNPDIPEVVGKWQDYAQSKKRLLFDKRLQNDPAAYAQAQVEANKKLAEVTGLIGDSAQRKKNLGKQLQDYWNPATTHKMEDNFNDRFNMSLNTPTSVVRDHPDFDNHYWQGVDQDFTKGVNEAAGKKRVLKTTYTPVGKLGESRIPTDISGGNTPEEFLSVLNNKSTDRKYASNAAKAFLNMPPEQVQQIKNHYAALPNEGFEPWGYKEKPDLTAKSDNPVDQFNSLQAMSHAINSVGHFESKSRKAEEDPEIKRKLNEASRMRLQASGINKRLAASKDLAAFKKSLGVDPDAAGEDGDIIQPLLDKWETDAKAGGNKPYYPANGPAINAYSINAPEKLRKALGVMDGGKMVYPDDIKVTDDHKYIPVFYKKTKESNWEPVKGASGNYAVDPTITVKPISRDDVKIAVGNVFLSKKDSKENIRKTYLNKPSGKPVKLKVGELDDIK